MDWIAYIALAISALSLIGSIVMLIWNITIWRKQKRFDAVVSRGNHVSQTQFDVEFEVYRQLSRAFFDMYDTVNWQSDEEIFQNAPESDHYKVAKKAADNARNLLHQNVPFIPKETFDKYDEILKIAVWQVNRWLEFNVGQENYPMTQEEATEEMRVKLYALHDEIREYIQNLKVIK